MAKWNNTPVQLTGRVFLHDDCIPTGQSSSYELRGMEPRRGDMLLRHGMRCVPFYGANKYAGNIEFRVFDGARWRTVRSDGVFSLSEITYQNKPTRWSTALRIRRQVTGWQGQTFSWDTEMKAFRPEPPR
jgi:hypothetical protein